MNFEKEISDLKFVAEQIRQHKRVAAMRHAHDILELSNELSKVLATIKTLREAQGDVREQD